MPHHYLTERIWNLLIGLAALSLPHLLPTLFMLPGLFISFAFSVHMLVLFGVVPSFFVRMVMCLAVQGFGKTNPVSTWAFRERLHGHEVVARSWCPKSLCCCRRRPKEGSQKSNADTGAPRAEAVRISFEKVFFWFSSVGGSSSFFFLLFLFRRSLRFWSNLI